ncbi:hypothetical protein FS150101_NMOIFPPK_00790 [Fructilactobacillus sanfranciscensis]|uniref:hypothetical protein n=1 Tax=Fructilactobacillus sanfranciscensis TaxID=1625 RepID=UPI00384EFC40
MFKWYEYKTIKAANHALSFNGNYATVIIPKDLSQSVQTVGQTGQKSTVKIVINQGRNHTSATNVSSVFFQPIWITSLVTTMLLYFASRAFQPKHKKDVLDFKGTVVGIVALLSLIVGFVTTFYVSQFLGYHFPDSPLISLFLAIATFAFIMLFSGVIAWIEIPGVVIFALLMFFSLPLMVMAPQMLPQAYQDYFLPWLPMRFLYEGIREILYFKAGFLNQNTWSLIIVAGIGLLMFFLETFGKRHQKTFI